MNKKIFISYSWKNIEEADEIDTFFKRKGIILTRDKRSLDYTENIFEFMNKIREHDFFILLLSEEYFKSLNCMKELFLAFKEVDFQKKVLPLVIEDNFYSEDMGINIYNYWKNREKEYEKKLKEYDPADIYVFYEELNDIKNIVLNITKNISYLKKLLLVTFYSEKENSFFNLLEKIGQIKNNNFNNSLSKNLFIPNLKRINSIDKKEFIKKNFLRINEIFKDFFEKIKEKNDNFDYSISNTNDDTLIIEMLVDNQPLKKIAFWIGGFFDDNCISYKFLSNYETNISKNSLNGNITLQLNSDTKEMEFYDVFSSLYDNKNNTIEGIIENIIKNYFLIELEQYSNKVRQI